MMRRSGFLFPSAGLRALGSVLSIVLIGVLFVGGAAAWALPAHSAAGATRAETLGEPGSGDYPQFLFNGRNRVNPHETILSPATAPNLTSFWTLSVGDDGPFAAPVVADSRVFEGEYVGNVQAIDATTGHVDWSYQTAAPVGTASAVSRGLVFAGDKSGTLYAIDQQTGTLRWSGSAGQQFFDPDTITVSKGGSKVYTSTVALPSPGGALAAWKASGCGASTCSPLWTANTKTLDTNPAVDASSATVFVASAGGYLYAFSASGCGASVCKPLWRGLIGSSGPPDTYGSLAIANGIIYVGTVQSSGVEAFSTAGCGAARCQPLWGYHVDVVGPSALAVADHKVFVSDHTGLHAFAVHCPRGSVCDPVWTDADAPDAKLLVANEVVYGTSGFNVLADAASTGRRLWTRTIPDTCASGPAVANGVVYFAATFANEILAYHLPSAAPPRGLRQDEPSRRVSDGLDFGSAVGHKDSARPLDR
jgi:outer membrane protein assembly factor BamB